MMTVLTPLGAATITIGTVLANAPTVGATLRQGVRVGVAIKRT